MTRIFCSIVFFFAFAFAFTPAFAQSNAQVDKLKIAADDAMDNLRYGEALDGYQKAYALSHEPRFLYNMGRSLGALGRYPEAVAKLERFRMDASAELRARVPLEQIIADFKKHVSTLNVQCSVTGARVVVRDQVIGQTPLGAVDLNAGAATVEVSADDYVTQRKQVDLPGGSSLDVMFNLVRASPTGILVVRSTPQASSILIDGRGGFGGTPLETSLLPGSHALLLTHEGFRDLAASAVVERGERRVLDLRFEKSPSIFTRWWFWTIVGVAVVAVVTTATAYAICSAPGGCEHSPDMGTIPPYQEHGP